MKSPDKDLAEVERIGEGDAVAFTRVYDLYSTRVYGFAFRMLNAQATAEDITHEAFLVLIQHPERYCSNRGSLLTFLCSIARNQILKHFRRLGYEVEDPFDDQSPHLMKTEYDQNPLSTLLEQELAAKVNAAIAMLPILQRETLILREFQELSYHEISIVTGTDINVVKARLYRARQTLGNKLASYMHVSGESCYELRRSY
jgi:RNA polymerase sigma-70 factor (ECF subfamily)